MPNWCMTRITFHGENAKKLEKLIDEWTSEGLPGVDFGGYWLGNCLVKSGVMSFDEAAYGDIRCRGTIDYVEYTDEDELTMETSSAWSPAVEMWYLINDKLNLDLDIVYTAEEPGCELYWTNDPAVEGTWMYEMHGDDDGNEYEVDEKVIKEIYEEFIKSHPDAETQITHESYYAESGDNYFYAHKYLLVDDMESL